MRGSSAVPTGRRHVDGGAAWTSGSFPPPACGGLCRLKPAFPAVCPFGSDNLFVPLGTAGILWALVEVSGAALGLG
ncbi:MAG: hypothetical protein OYL41_05545 [Acidobacteriota bacterium]|nr:hypothetical protein [Acidobacteriota bacterium]MXW70520.1 hypothetical protein [Acidobacteriota bacterium]MYE43665.1 hypothetical protein [Acidobacteriota bacterium]